MIPIYQGNLLDKAQTFFLPFSDLGSGAVSTTPSACGGSGTATYARATVAWTKLSTGLWTQVASGTARSCYLGADTAVGAYGGYFCEKAGTQLVTPTASIRDMTDASWVNGGTMTVAKTGTGIDGVSNSCSRLTAGAVSATNTLFQTLTAAASSRTYSCWIKRVTGAGVINITQDGGSTYTDVTSQINSSTFTRVSLTASVLNAAFGIQVVTQNDVILVDFNQFEAGAIPTSPMASAGAARNSDTLSYATSENFSDTAGTAYVEHTPTAVGTVSAIIASSTASTIGPIFTAADRAIAMGDGTNTLFVNPSSATAAMTTYKVAGTWSGSTMTGCKSGGTPQSGSYDGSWNMVTIAIGSPAPTVPYTFIKNVRIYNVALSNAQIISMTT